MKYRTKVIINGAELPDEQKDNASSITGVSVTGSCGNGFQIGSTASSMLEFTVIKPYKESFDGDKVDFYVLPMESEEEESRTDALEAEVGDREETEHIEDTDEENDVDTEETEDTDEEAEDVTEAEEVESEAEMDALELDLYDMMNGEAAEDGEGTEEEAVPEGNDWDILGTFYVFKQQNNNDGTVTLQCFDGFQMMNDPYIPAQKNGTFQQFYDDIRAQCQAKGIIVDEETFEAELNPVLEWNQDCTLREAIGYLAGLQGGFATFGDDNTLGISYFGYNDEVLLTSELLSRTTTSAGETMVDGIVCTVNLKQDTMEAGEGGQSLYMYNPFMTQELLDNIFSQYRGIRYTGAVVQARWDPSLVPGEFVRIMTDSEYMNYVAMNNAMANSAGKTAEEILSLKKEINAVGKSLLVSTQKITFGGETTVEIRSHLMTETEKANAPLSPSDAKFRVVTADLIRTKELIAQKAEIEDLKATNALIKNLQAEKLSAEDADLRYVNIDFSKIDKAWLQEFYAQSGIIKDLVIGDSTVTGHLVGVTISGDLLEGNTVKADKLVVKGEDGLYYKLNIEGGSTVTPQLTKEMLQNGLDGSNIIANTITAEKVKVDDLIAFDATIGGFNIASNAIYSGVKSSVDNTTRGMYLGADGQMNFGDSNNYIKYHKDEKTGKYALEIMADHMIFGSTGTNVQDAIEDLRNKAQTAQNTATEAAKTADNYISTDSTGIMVSENKGATKETPSNATKNNVLITEKDVQIRNGKKVVASYGETIDIGGESEQHVTIAKDKMAVNAGTESLFSVDSFKSGTEIISTWINTDKLTPTEDIYPEISDSIAFSVEYINDTIDQDGSYSDSYNYSFYNKGAKRVWFELEGGETITINKAVSGNSLHYEEFSNSGNEYFNGFTLDTSEKITRTDIIALRAAYDIEFNPAIVDIGQYRTKDIITYRGMNLYDFKALKIGSGIASENNRRDAFTVDFLGNGYFGNTLNVEQDIRAMYIGAAQADVNKISAENISADNITMNIQRGTGKITLTTGAVEYQPRWWQCGNIVQMEVGTKCTGKVASGANIAAGKITGVPKPITKSGVRAVSYYGNNANISYMGSDGTFYARNAGADALAKDNDCIGGFTYITDGTML